MSETVNGVVKKIYHNQANTKFGPKTTYKVELEDGTRVSWGFKTPTFKEGADISVEVISGQYGNEFKGGQLTVNSDGAGVANVTPINTGPSDVHLSRELSIIRQSSIKAAVDTLAASGMLGADSELAAMEVIKVANIYTKWASGKMELEAAAEQLGLDVDELAANG